MGRAMRVVIDSIGPASFMLAPAATFKSDILLNPDEIDVRGCFSPNSGIQPDIG